MTIATLADVRELMRHLPEDRRARSTWRHIASQLEAAAAGSVDLLEASILLRLVLTLEGVECWPRCAVARGQPITNGGREDLRHRGE
jgi:hypothetical protein